MSLTTGDRGAAGGRCATVCTAAAANSDLQGLASSVTHVKHACLRAFFCPVVYLTICLVWLLFFSEA